MGESREPQRGSRLSRVTAWYPPLLLAYLVCTLLMRLDSVDSVGSGKLVNEALSQKGKSGKEPVLIHRHLTPSMPRLASLFNTP